MLLRSVGIVDLVARDAIVSKAGYYENIRKGYGKIFEKALYKRHLHTRRYSSSLITYTYPRIYKFQSEISYVRRISIDGRVL